MARIRSIKPSFFTSDHVATLSMAARLLYAGLWTLADREGRLEDRPRRIKVEIMPYDDVDTDSLLAELAAGDDPFIDRYEVDGKAYIQVLAFTEHQKPHPKEPKSVIPARSGQDTASREETRPAVERNGEPGKGHVEPGGLWSMVSGSLVSGLGSGYGASAATAADADEPHTPAEPASAAPGRRSPPADGIAYTRAENDAYAAATGRTLAFDRPARSRPTPIDQGGKHRTQCHGFGTLPSCARGLCVPNFLGQKWVTQSNHVDDPAAFVAQFIADVVRRTPDGPVGDELKFWQAQWDAAHRAREHRPAPMRSGSMDWADECRELHGSACLGQYAHGLRMRVDDAKVLA
jgi:hypothetical protein